MDDTDGRSLHSGISIPQWMKSKITDTRLDFEEAAFSPPQNDDSFLYIRYPQEISKKLKSPLLDRRISNSTIVAGRDCIDNHTESCKQYILRPEHPTTPLTNAPNLKIKSNGVDDGFKGEGAACGSSVIRFAHQMVSGKYPTDDAPNAPSDALLKRRRGSKSLPASPQTSPKTRRRAHKYFTGAFVDGENPGGWLLHGLLSKRDASHSELHLSNEEEVGGGGGELLKAVSELRLNEESGGSGKPKATKPSEFREMNFWSPTST